MPWEVPPMQAFIVEAANRPGEFARHTAAIATRGINLYAMCLSWGDRGAAAFIPSDEAGCRTALRDSGIAFREVPVLTCWLEDRPGTAATASKRLADAGINLELFAPVDTRDGKVIVALGVDKVEEARRVLSDQLIQWMVPAGTAEKVGATR